MAGNKVKKILIVDDEALITKILSIRFQSDGFEVEVASDGDEGIDKAMKFLPDLAIIDIGLPKIDGNTLCELIKKNKSTANTKVIILTGKKLVGDMEKAFESGADAYVSKPYDYQILLNKVKKLIGE
jgi:DNA-binding response OmpR family regulator